MKPIGKQKIITLGLLETAICAVMAFLVSWKVDNFTYVAVWSLVGWTQLLRTGRSTVLGLRLFVPVFDRLTRGLLVGMEAVGAIKDWPGGVGKKLTREENGLPNHEGEQQPTRGRLPMSQFKRRRDAMWNFIRPYMPDRGDHNPIILAALICWGTLRCLTEIILATMALVASAALIRAVTTITTAAVHPGEALRAIPRNWRRIGWSLEMMMPLEFVARHRLFLRLRERGAPLPAPEGVLGSFAITQRTSYDTGNLTRTAICLAGAALLIWLPCALHNPQPTAARRLPTFPSTVLDFDESGMANSHPGKTAAGSNQYLPGDVSLTESKNETHPSVSVEPRRESDADHVVPDVVNLSWKEKFERSSRARELARQKLRERQLMYFDLLDLDDWTFRYSWYSQWPIRQFGETWLTKQLCFMLYLYLVGGGLCLLATYLGLWMVVILGALATPLRVILFLPALAYRFSLKASALTYAPLLFVVEGSVVQYDDPIFEFQKEQEAVLPATRRWAANLLGAFLLAKIAFRTALTTGSTAIERYFPRLPWQLDPKWIYPWEIASGLVVFLTFLIWLLTRDTLWRSKQGTLRSLWKVARVVRSCQSLRSVLSIYTICCIAYIWASIDLYQVLQTIDWPPIRWIMFPVNRH